ncbi:MAG: M48 family metallopeptidase [Oscillospiraceae bacterium]|nr:M48 family metallopeptidase [Oscillospiraceae bacterium]
MTYQLIRSDRKTISLQLTPQGELIVRCPQRMKKAEVDAFVQSKADWVAKHREHLAQIPSRPRFTPEEVNALAERALAVIPERVTHYAKIVGVTYGRITIRNQHSRWGSCSGAGNLNFNCLLMLTPSEVIDYVVVHELCHRKEMNHSPAFWAEVEKVLPDYKERKKWLKENGSALISRL